jgi:hypothetical protein
LNFKKKKSVDEEVEKVIVKGRMKGSKNYNNDVLIDIIESFLPNSSHL